MTEAGSSVLILRPWGRHCKGGVPSVCIPYIPCNAQHVLLCLGATTHAHARVPGDGCTCGPPTPSASSADTTGGPPVMLASAPPAVLHQIRWWGDEVAGVHPGHQADVVAVMHEDVDGYDVPLVLPGVQLQDLLADNLVAI